MSYLRLADRYLEEFRTYLKAHNYKELILSGDHEILRVAKDKRTAVFFRDGNGFILPQSSIAEAMIREFQFDRQGEESLTAARLAGSKAARFADRPKRT